MSEARASAYSPSLGGAVRVTQAVHWEEFSAPGRALTGIRVQRDHLWSSGSVGFLESVSWETVPGKGPTGSCRRDPICLLSSNHSHECTRTKVQVDLTENHFCHTMMTAEYLAPGDEDVIEAWGGVSVGSAPHMGSAPSWCAFLLLVS